MELAFADKSLRQLCESKATADRKLGVKIAERFRRRLADLHAANCVQALVAGKPRPLENHQFAVEISAGFRIVFCANHNAIPHLESGDVDWNKVSRIKILKVENPNACG